MSSFIETIFGGSANSVIYLKTDQSLATITAPGWIQTIQPGYNYRQGDLVAAVFGSNNTPENFQISISASDVVTLNKLSNLFTLDLTVSAAQLANAGKVNFLNALPGQQFIVRNLSFTKQGTGISGGGGDRGIQITDGTSQYATLTSNQMGTPANMGWGQSNFAYGNAAVNVPTQAGANLYVQYNGGTTDWTTGTLNFTALLERVA